MRLIVPRSPAALIFSLLLTSWVAGQGTFPPTGSPTTPIMKTLQQIEPRVDLLNSVGANGVTTSASVEFIISAPGAYYLSGNLAATKTHGIQINSAGVTLDLNGFEISRASGSGGDAIQSGTGLDQIVICNGALRGFANGVNLSSTQRGSRIQGVRARQMTGTGLQSGESSLIEDCTAVACGIGIQTENHSVLSRCTADACTGLYGIIAGLNSSLTSCTATNGTHPTGYGIFAATGSSLTGCVASKNAGTRGIIGVGSSTMLSCAANNNTSVFGIEIGLSGTLTNCTANGNTNTSATSGGILGAGNNVLTGCSANFNTSTAGTLTSTTGLGIQLGANSIMTGCSANNNKGDGVQTSFSSIRQCTASSNAQYGLVATQRSTIAECVANGNVLGGIRVNFVCLVKDCIASQNSFHGIIVESGGGCDIRGNTCEENGNNVGATGAGIRVNGSFTRVEDNHVYVNWKGIEVNGVVGVFVVRNAAASHSGGNFVIASGNKVGTIVSAPASGAISGGTGGAGVGSTDPWANISY